jgi:hypothetical protein
MFNINDFLAAQRCMWLSRAHRLQIDNWRYDLKFHSPGNNILLIRPCDIDANIHLILRGMVLDYQAFYSKFCAANGNYKRAYIFDNDCFKIGPAYTGNINRATFGNGFYERYKIKLRSLNYENCFFEGHFKTIPDFAADGLPFTPAAWMLLRSSILRAKALLTKNDPAKNNICTNIEAFMQSNTKGSKRFRKFFCYPPVPVHAIPVPVTVPVRAVQTFANLINLPPPEGTSLKIVLSSWNHYCMHNNVREFIFKFRYNYLALNNRVNAFNPDIDPRCTFCRIRDPNTHSRDSLRHFFWDCPTSNALVLNLWRKYFENDVQIGHLPALYWYGTLTGTEHDYQSINLIFWDICRYVLYCYKGKRTVPNFPSFEREVLFKFKTSLNLYNKNIIENKNFFTRLSQAIG